MLGIAAPVAAGFIRLANLMNSEIIGMPTTLPWAFVPPAPASGSALRSACLFPVLRHHGLDIPEAERHCPQRLLFRALHRLDIHFPFLHRVSQRTSSRVRERYAYRHGAGVEHSFHPAGALFRIPKRKNQNIIRAQQKSH